MDGDYLLTIDASRVTSQGFELDGNADGTAGDDHLFGAVAVDNFYRKYGDYNSNRVVDLLDFAEFRRTFGESDTDMRFLEGLDHDSNGTIDLLDFAAFRRNFGT